MGVDLKGVINHELTKKELLKLPLIIDTWKEIKEIILQELPKTYSAEYIEEKYSNLRCAYFNKDLSHISKESIPDENYLEKVWSQWSKKFKSEILTIQIITYFSTITLNRNTLIIEQMPWHKYSNLNVKDMAKMILKINRVIARKLNQNKIVYFPDSTYPTSIINEYAEEGKTTEELIDIANSKFSNTPKAISEGIQFKYFVDDFSDDLSGLVDINNSEKYWKWNSVLKKYQQTITLHNK